MKEPTKRILQGLALAVIGFSIAFLLVGCPEPRPTVLVEVCTVSGVLPNLYCPEKVTRRFYVDEQPTTLCTVHVKPAEPVKPVPPFIGATVYQGIVFNLEDVLAYINRAADQGQNAQEFFFHFSWPYPMPTTGAFYSTFARAAVAWYKDTASAYGNMEFPLFDLGVKRIEEPGYAPPRNEEIWSKWDSIFARCYEKSQAVFIRFKDFCSVKDGAAKRSYPFRANTLRLGADGVTPDPQDRTWYNWQGGEEAAVKRSLGWLIDALKKSKVEYFIVPENESDSLEATDALKDAEVLHTHEVIIGELLRLGVAEDHIVISTSRVLDQLHAKWPAAKIELHGCDSPERMNEYKAAYHFGPENISFNGDGFDPNAQGVAGDNPAKREPSIAQGAAMGNLARSWSAFAVLFFAREVESESPPDINRISEGLQVVRAVAGK